MESEASLPVEEEFWDFLFSSSKETWNLLVYEQDWLDVAVTRLQALRVSSPPLTHLVFPERLFDYVLPFTHRKFGLCMCNILEHTHISFVRMLGRLYICEFLKLPCPRITHCNFHSQSTVAVQSGTCKCVDKRSKPIHTSSFVVTVESLSYSCPKDFSACPKNARHLHRYICIISAAEYTFSKSRKKQRFRERQPACAVHQNNTFV